MREIGTQKMGSHITNLHIKRPRVTVNQRIGSRKEAISGSHILEIADKKTAYNEGIKFRFWFKTNICKILIRCHSCTKSLKWDMKMRGSRYSEIVISSCLTVFAEKKHELIIYPFCWDLWYHCFMLIRNIKHSVRGSNSGFKSGF